jgi:hypothetical protein
MISARSNWASLKKRPARRPNAVYDVIWKNEKIFNHRGHREKLIFRNYVNFVFSKTQWEFYFEILRVLFGLVLKISTIIRGGNNDQVHYQAKTF